VNEKLNAIVEWNPNALDEARALDEYFATEKTVKGPLHGIPVTIKEMAGVKGFKQTSGAPALKDFTPVGDSTVAARLKAAGAIVLGTTNNMELGLAFDSDNHLYGRTKNPYDLNRTAGGSSGGEGAIIAAGGSPLGIGTDLGGSIRVPSHFCGIVGLKPTQNSVSLFHHGALGVEMLTGFLPSMINTGPMARYVSDIELALEIISGADFEDPFCHALPYKRPAESPLPKRVAYFTTDNLIPAVHPSVQQAVRTVAELLANEGVQVTEAMPAEFPSSSDMMFRAFAIDGAIGAKTVLSMGQKPPTPPVARLLADIDSKSLVLDTREQLTQLQSVITSFRKKMLAFFKDYDALILPPCAHPACLPVDVCSDESGQHNVIAAFRFTYAWNVASLPSLVVGAVGTGTEDFEGLPVGVQIVFPPFHEPTAFAIARLLEEKIPSVRSLRPLL